MPSDDMFPVVSLHLGRARGVAKRWGWFLGWASCSSCWERRTRLDVPANDRLGPVPRLADDRRRDLAGGPRVHEQDSGAGFSSTCSPGSCTVWSDS